VRCADGALYTGIALDVVRRLADHDRGRGAKALRGRGPLVLVLRRRIGDKGDALRAELALKRLPKADKERLLQDARRQRRFFRACRSSDDRRKAAGRRQEARRGGPS
jgi:putative endonuclease